MESKINQIQKFIDAQAPGNVRYVRVFVVSPSSARACKMVPIYDSKEEDIKKTLKKMSETGVGFLSALISFPLSQINIHPESEFNCTGERKMCVDLESVYSLPWNPKHLLAFCDVKDNITYQRDGVAPRMNLKNILETAQKDLGLTFRVGFELELNFLLRKDKDKIKEGEFEYYPIDEGLFSDHTKLDTHMQLIEEITFAASELGIQLELIHHEGGSGQYEFVMTHYPCLEAVDKYYVFREAICHICASKGVVPCFFPRQAIFYYILIQSIIFSQFQHKIVQKKFLLQIKNLYLFLIKFTYSADTLGNGCHVHVSVWKNGENLTEVAFTKPQVNNNKLDKKIDHSLEGAQFISGILEYMQDIMAFLCSKTYSYQRISVNTWAGSTKCWGYDNKEAAIRFNIVDQGMRVTNFEIKPLDHVANHYLALTAIIGAGIQGIKEKLKLPEGNNDNDPAKVAQNYQQLPSSIGKAIECLKKSEKVKNFMGERVVKNYIEQCVLDQQIDEKLTLAQQANLYMKQY